MRSTLWPRVGRSVTAHPLLTDVALAISLTVVSVLLGRENPPGDWRRFDEMAYVLTALVTLPTAFRRKAPTTVLIVCCSFWILYVAAGYWPFVNTYGMLVAFYTVAATRPYWVVALGVVAGAVVWIYSGVVTPQGSIPSVVAQSVAVPIVVWRLGSGAKQLAIRNRQLAEAAEQLRRGSEERARRAVTDERVRIARELHDVVAHHMSVVWIQAELARYVLRSDPTVADGALGTVLDTTGEALEELRRLLALLRVGSEQAGPQTNSYNPAPGLSDLPELFNRVRSAGVPVEVTVTGTPHPLSPGLELCAYRVIQECLTNVLKHAAPATATVTVHHGGDEFNATVRDDGQRPAGIGAPRHGLIGMRERAMLYGGSLVAGPLPGRGFEVTLTLPTRVQPVTGPEH